MDRDNATTRRQFLRTCARCAGAAAVAGVAGGLVVRADADKVWQLDPNVCDTCIQVRNPASVAEDGWAQCARECVLWRSAVKAVNDFPACGYCLICPAYHDTTSAPAEDGTYVGRVCPQDAILRRPVGDYDPYDPNNNFFEYSIDEEKCNGCGRCVELCKPPRGNGSLRLEVRHDLCVDCNQCNIARACPVDAFQRVPVTGRPHPGYTRPHVPDHTGHDVG